MNGIFSIKKLESLLIDVKNKKFLINNEDFGKKCTRISVECIPPKWKVRVIIDKPYEFQFNMDGEEL